MAGDNEKQEEIVLGNKQLLSIFFIVVILLGVAFTIGYMIGKNTTTVSAANVPAANGPAANGPQPEIVTQPTRSAGPPAAAPPAAADADATPASTDVPRVVGTHPAKPFVEPATKTAEADPLPPTGEAKPAPPVGSIGTYLQVVALKRGDADHMVKVLQDRGFPALLGESPKEGLFRVLVGPYGTMADVAESKQKLRAAGFDPIVAR